MRVTRYRNDVMHPPIRRTAYMAGQSDAGGLPVRTALATRALIACSDAAAIVGSSGCTYRSGKTPCLRAGRSEQLQHHTEVPSARVTDSDSSMLQIHAVLASAVSRFDQLSTLCNAPKDASAVTTTVHAICW